MASILVVEDDSTTQVAVRKALESAGHTVSVASNGDEGLAAITREKPDLLLLDIMLPKVDGFEICHVVSKLPEEDRPVIVLMTALADILDSLKEDWLIQTGARKLLTKPLDRGHLIEVVDELLKLE